MKTRRWMAGLTALTAALLAGCGAAARSEPESASGGQEPPADVPEDVSSGEQAAEAPQPLVAPTENYGPAPEITNEVWLNTDTPLRLADQRGKVVLVEFWTFG